MQIWDPEFGIQQGANSGAGCCPFCTVVNTPSCKELHLWQEYWHAHEEGGDGISPWDAKHPYSFSPISLLKSCYCPLHADLRLFGDTFINFLAEIALHHGRLEEWVEAVKGCGVAGFNATKKDDGSCESTALQGGQCRKLRAQMDTIIEETGVGDTKWIKKDQGGALKTLRLQCTSGLEKRWHTLL